MLSPVVYLKSYLKNAMLTCFQCVSIKISMTTLHTYNKSCTCLRSHSQDSLECPREMSHWPRDPQEHNCLSSVLCPAFTVLASLSPHLQPHSSLDNLHELPNFSSLKLDYTSLSKTAGWIWSLKAQGQDQPRVSLYLSVSETNFTAPLCPDETLS